MTYDKGDILEKVCPQIIRPALDRPKRYKKMAKLNRVLFRLIPEGSVKERMRSLYYRFYYNHKRLKENNFYVYYDKGIFEYKFPDGITFKSCVNVEEELRLSLWGYISSHKLKAGEIVIDCGADVGDFTMYASRVVGASGKVIAFEPDPIIYGRLKFNVELNKLNNVILIKKGVWSENTTLKFMSAKDKPRSFLFDEAGEGIIEIPVVSIDSELKELKIGKVDFIKMDVEGAEIEAVKGAVRILANNKVDLAIASYHMVNGEKTCFKLESAFSVIGYKAETAYPKHLTTYATNKS